MRKVELNASELNESGMEPVLPPNTFHVPDEMLKSIRELRVWHWAHYKNFKAQASKDEVDEYFEAYQFHLKQVQLLNGFFHISDTAENDYLQCNLLDR